MTTLDDLLALLPDNETGDISAADMRFIVTTLWDGGAQGADLAAGYAETTNARIDALEAAEGTGLGTVATRWKADKSIPVTTQSGAVSADTRDFATATELIFDHMDLLETDIGNVVGRASEIHLQVSRDATDWVTYDVTGTPTLAGNDWTVPVNVTGHAGSVNGSDVVVVIFTVPVAS